MKIPLLISGMTGLVGSHIAKQLTDTYECVDMGRSAGVDITDPVSVTSYISNSKASYILHCAAKTDVDGCEAEKALGESSQAWKINVGGTENIVKSALQTGKRVIYISTDFVFSGQDDTYTEDSVPAPLNWYGETKYQGERIVLGQKENAVVRIAYPYSSHVHTKPDFVHVIAQKMKDGTPVSAVTDHFFCPTYIDEVATVIKIVLEKNLSGIYHSVGQELVTAFMAAETIAQFLGLPTTMVIPTTCAEFYKNRAPRPYKLDVKNVKIKSYGIQMSGFSNVLMALKAKGVSL